MNQPKTVIPVTIVTGYLGSGKTTLISHLLQSEPHKKLAVVINDFGSVELGERMHHPSRDQQITLANGCTCCTNRGDLIEAVLPLLEGAERPDHILIETSGVADPSQILLTFNRSALRTRTYIDSIITVVDGENVLSNHGRIARLLMDQVRVADLIVLNKLDLLDERQQERVQRWIQMIVPRARVLETVYGRVPVETVLGVNTYNPQTAFDTSDSGVHVQPVKGAAAPIRGENSLVFGTWQWEGEKPVSISRMREALEDLPQTVFRVKGVLYTAEFPDEQIILQVVGKRISLTSGSDWGNQPARTQIILVGTSKSMDARLLQERFESTEVSARRSQPVDMDRLVRRLNLGKGHEPIL
jgi:G3E family GTPase